MPILIDGHNLIGRLGGLSLADADDETRLVRRLVAHGARTGKRITVVFDPGVAFDVGQTRRLGTVEAVFVPHGSSADAAILKRVRQSRHPPDWLVVTSDQELAQAVRSLGARVMGAEAFAAELEARQGRSPEARESPPSPQEVEDWLAIFGGKRKP